MRKHAFVLYKLLFAALKLRQMAIKSSVSNDLRSSFFYNINVLDCGLSGVITVQWVGLQSVIVAFPG